MRSTKLYLHSLKCEVGGGHFITFSNLAFPSWGIKERVSSLSGSRLSPLTNSYTVKATGSVGTPRQPRHAWRQPICILDLPTQHWAADRTALLRRHLLAPLDPRTPRRGEATVRGVVCPAAPRLRAQPALAG